MNKSLVLTFCLITSCGQGKKSPTGSNTGGMTQDKKSSTESAPGNTAEDTLEFQDIFFAKDSVKFYATGHFQSGMTVPPPTKPNITLYGVDVGNKNILEVNSLNSKLTYSEAGKILSAESPWLYLRGVEADAPPIAYYTSVNLRPDCALQGRESSQTQIFGNNIIFHENGLPSHVILMEKHVYDIPSCAVKNAASKDVFSIAKKLEVHPNGVLAKATLAADYEFLRSDGSRIPYKQGQDVAFSPTGDLIENSTP